MNLGLGLKQYDVISTKEQSVLIKIISSFEGENMQTQYYKMDTATEILTAK